MPFCGGRKSPGFRCKSAREKESAALRKIDSAKRALGTLPAQRKAAPDGIPGHDHFLAETTAQPELAQAEQQAIQSEEAKP